MCQPPAPELFHGRTCDYITRKPVRNVSIFKLCEIIVHLFSVCVCVFVFWSSLDERYPRYRLYMTLHDFTKFQDPPRSPIVPVFLGYVGFVGWFWGSV